MWRGLLKRLMMLIRIGSFILKIGSSRIVKSSSGKANVPPSILF